MQRSVADLLRASIPAHTAARNPGKGNTLHTYCYLGTCAPPYSTQRTISHPCMDEEERGGQRAAGSWRRSYPIFLFQKGMGRAMEYGPDVAGAGLLLVDIEWGGWGG